MEKKDKEVGLDSRLLKKDNKRFMRSRYVVSAGERKAVPRAGLKGTAQQCAHSHS